MLITTIYDCSFPQDFECFPFLVHQSVGNNIKHRGSAMFRFRSSSLKFSGLVRKSSANFSQAVDVQPAVKYLLLVPKDTPAYDCSKFVKVSSDSVGILPFADRETSLKLISKVLFQNEYPAKNLSFCCTGLMYGSGKTLFAINLARYIAKVLKEQGDDNLRKCSLVSVHIDNTLALNSLYSIWEDFILKDPSMSELNSLVNASMSLKELLSVTGTFLTEQNKVLYLHLDEFIPSDSNICELFLNPRSFSNFKSGELQGVDVLDAMWRETLMSFLSTQRVMLFVTGESPLYDQIGNGPSIVVRPPMALLEKKHIVEIFDNFAVHQTNELAPMSLSAAHRMVVRMPDDRANEDCVEVLSSEIHELSRGVPHYVELAINGMFRSPDAHFLFAANKHKKQVPLSTVSDQLSNPSNYTLNIESHTGEIKDAIKLLPKPQKMHMINDLLSVLHATSAPCLVSEDKYMTHGNNKDFRSIGRLLNAAQFWGVFHTYDSVAQGVRFVIPKVSEPMVQDCYRYLVWNVAELKDLLVEQYDGTDQQNALRVERALMMDRASLCVDSGRPSLLSIILNNHLYECDWLAKTPSRGVNDVMEHLRSTPPIKYVPKVDMKGLANLDDVRLYSKRTHSREFKQSCTPNVLAQFMVENSQQRYFIVAPDGIHNASGDRFVCHCKLWLHFHLMEAVDSDALHEIGKFLSLVKFAPEREEGYEHILILQSNANKDKDMRTSVLCAVEKLLVAARNKKEDEAVRNAFSSLKDLLPSKETVLQWKAEAKDKVKDTAIGEVEAKGQKLKTKSDTMDGVLTDGLVHMLQVLCAHSVNVVVLSEQENKDLEALGDHFLFKNRIQSHNL